jgi:predicted porin
MTGKDRIALWLAGAAIAAVPALAIAAETIAYKYDARGRLVEVVRNVNGTGNVVTAYSFDKADNRVLKNTSGSPNPGPP